MFERSWHLATVLFLELFQDTGLCCLRSWSLMANIYTLEAREHLWKCDTYLIALFLKYINDGHNGTRHFFKNYFIDLTLLYIRSTWKIIIVHKNTNCMFLICTFMSFSSYLFFFSPNLKYFALHHKQVMFFPLKFLVRKLLLTGHTTFY